MKNRFVPGVAIVALVGLGALTNGCSAADSVQDAACCTEFEAGGTIDVKISGSAEAQVAAQAIADFSGVAAASIDDITTACRGLATDLDASQADKDAAEKTADKRGRMKAWCSLAVTTIGTFKAQAKGTLKVDFQPPVCEASFSAKANCQAKCSASGQCDIKADPPRCEGGKLEVSCKGECKGEANAAISCEGSCTGECSGSCQAEGGVKCAGKCQGTCEGAAGAGSNGVDAQGNCQGTCKGTCEVTAPKATCSGSCKGSCTASCKATANVAVKCDGKCDVEAEPLKCQGGELKGGCKVEAKCEGNCDASIKAKAECKPPSLTVVFSGAADIQAAGKLKAAFEANMGAILAFEARLKGMATATGTITANASAVGDIKAACIPVLIAAAGTAAGDITESVSATASVAGTLK